MEMTFEVFRYDPDNDSQPRYQQYQVSAEPNERILDCLNRIKWEQDGTLAFRVSCGHGVCGSDAMRINGRCALACQTLIKDCEGDKVILEPLPNFKVLKDLIVDMEPFFERVRLIQPYLKTTSDAPEQERRQDREDQKKLDHVIRCILCACCMGACPVKAENENFLGPAPLVWAFRYIFDSRDEMTKERLVQMDDPDAAWACENHFKCTQVCPKEIPVTKSINTIKREIKNVLRDKE